MGSADAALDAQLTSDATALASDAGTALVDAGEGTSDAARLDGATSGGRVTLVRHQLWTRVDAALDPFADAPSVVDCGQGATGPELLGDEPVFSVDTGLCNYVTVSQPALLGVALGESIKIRLWHFDLSAPEPAQAHAVLSVDGVAVLDERIAIPQPGGLLVREVRVTREIAAGARVLFHLHNHGSNSWSLVEVSKGPG